MHCNWPLRLLLLSAQFCCVFPHSSAAEHQGLFTMSTAANAAESRLLLLLLLLLLALSRT
jgi:hypothetical protein